LLRRQALEYPPPPESTVRPPLAPPLRWLARIALVAAGATLVGLLVTASRLAPSSDGYGTDQQLGLPPCTIVRWYGVRCPSCGMTTSWAHLLDGEPVLALRANVGGTLLAVVAIVCGPWMLISGLWGRWIVRPPGEMVAVTIGVVLVLATLIDWAVR
jgi:hypothetical protein